MTATLETPLAFVESLAHLKFPGKTDRRLQDLMDRNTDGQLTQSERDELESLAELSETMSLFRGEALRLLGRVSPVTVVSNVVAQRVRKRAANRCEYCQMDQSLQGATFHIEHILPRSFVGWIERRK